MEVGADKRRKAPGNTCSPANEEAVGRRWRVPNARHALLWPLHCNTALPSLSGNEEPIMTSISFRKRMSGSCTAVNQALGRKGGTPWPQKMLSGGKGQAICPRVCLAGALIHLAVQLPCDVQSTQTCSSPGGANEEHRAGSIASARGLMRHRNISQIAGGTGQLWAQ